MIADHFDEALRAFVATNPFRPFTVELTGSRRFEVDFVNAITFRQGVAVFLAPGGIPIFFDHDSVVAFVGDIAGAGSD